MVLYWLLIGVYTILLCFILLLSIGRLCLVYYFNKQPATSTPPLLSNFPVVTIQLPIYNELYVVERLLAAVTAFNYPKDKLHIQVLDDSTDETTEILARLITTYQSQNWDIVHIRRAKNTGFKAGALQDALTHTKGEFVAIFDSDFVPQPSFLTDLLPHFTNPNTGMVQAAWSHLNADFSLLTRAQAFGLDAHFTVEQQGRNTADVYMNFNGTAGIWRKQCIIDAGGWQHDTLTEDLDLSYRAQLQGWKFVFVKDVHVPAELPVEMNAIKSQQYRWTKGSVETAKKLLYQITTGNISTKKCFFATLHLLNPFVFLAIFISSVLSVPLLWVKQQSSSYLLFFQVASIFVIGLFSMIYFHWKAYKNSGESAPTGKKFLLLFPLFLAISSGLAYHNAKAVLSGWVGFKTPFVRTPKFGMDTLGQKFRNNKYLPHKLPSSTLIELVLCLYFIAAIALGIYLHDYGLIPFHLLSAIGFGMIGGYSVLHARI